MEELIEIKLLPDYSANSFIVRQTMSDMILVNQPVEAKQFPHSMLDVQYSMFDTGVGASWTSSS
jgi:hypothetical protein